MDDNDYDMKGAVATSTTFHTPVFLIVCLSVLSMTLFASNTVETQKIL